MPFFIHLCLKIERIGPIRRNPSSLLSKRKKPAHRFNFCISGKVSSKTAYDIAVKSMKFRIFTTIQNWVQLRRNFSHFQE